jgi:hypothetical protein
MRPPCRLDPKRRELGNQTETRRRTHRVSGAVPFGSMQAIERQHAWHTGCWSRGDKGRVGRDHTGVCSQRRWRWLGQEPAGEDIRCHRESGPTRQALIRIDKHHVLGIESETPRLTAPDVNPVRLP